MPVRAQAARGRPGTLAIEINRAAGTPLAKPAGWWLCPNQPRCGHPAVLHDIYDSEDEMPRCCVPGCPCGARPQVPVPEPGDARTAEFTRGGYHAAMTQSQQHREPETAVMS